MSQHRTVSADAFLAELAPGLPRRWPDGSIGVDLDFADHGPPSMADAIRSYCDLGWHCFLLAPNSKKPPRDSRGLLDATTDADALLAQLRREPRANLAIAAGPSGLAVVDVDVRNDGDTTVAEAIRDHGPLGWSLSVCTPSGGAHYYFAAPSDRTITSGAHRYGHGVDSKSAGGYLVAPPSVIAGVPYVWRTDGATLQPLSGWALRLASAPAAEPAPVAAPMARGRWGEDVETRARRALAYVERIDPAIAGQGGHDQTFRVAVALVRGFELPRAVARHILAWYGARCLPPWSEREIDHKLASAERARVEPGYLLERGAA